MENVQLLLAQVIEAEYNKQVVDTFKEGVSAFKSTFKEAGLDEDNVSQVICDVQEVFFLKTYSIIYLKQIIKYEFGFCILLL